MTGDCPWGTVLRGVGVIRAKDRCGQHRQADRTVRTPKSQRYIVLNGQTSLTNAEVFDHQTGNGLVAEGWKENPGIGKAPNTWLDLVYRFLDHMNLDLDLAMNLIYFPQATLSTTVKLLKI